jgi:hypothetical protein
VVLSLFIIELFKEESKLTAASRKSAARDWRIIDIIPCLADGTLKSYKMVGAAAIVRTFSME